MIMREPRTRLADRERAWRAFGLHLGANQMLGNTKAHLAPYVAGKWKSQSQGLAWRAALDVWGVISEIRGQA
ncbi:hypothetical protein ABIE91_007478 [Bradyrhizobium elkanii]